MAEAIYTGMDMTFICPRCGFHDDIHWRNAYYDPHTSIMNWDDFKAHRPVMAERFASGSRAAFDKDYAYEREPRDFKKPIKYIKRGTREEWKARGETLHLKAHYLDPGSNKARQLKKSNLHLMMRRTDQSNDGNLSIRKR